MDWAFSTFINGPDDGTEKTLLKLADTSTRKGLPGFGMSRLTNELHRLRAELEMIWNKKGCCLVGVSPPGKEWSAVGTPAGNNWLMSRSEGKSVRLLWIRCSAGEGKESLHTNCDLWAVSETPPSAYLGGFGHIWLMLSQSCVPTKTLCSLKWFLLNLAVAYLASNILGLEGKARLKLWCDCGANCPTLPLVGGFFCYPLVFLSTLLMRVRGWDQLGEPTRLLVKPHQLKIWLCWLIKQTKPVLEDKVHFCFLFK